MQEQLPSRLSILGQAPSSWQRFVDEFDPQDGYFEDGMHARLVEWAKMELLRLHHRASGDVEAERAQIAIMRDKAEQVSGWFETLVKADLVRKGR